MELHAIGNGSYRFGGILARRFSNRFLTSVIGLITTVFLLGGCQTAELQRTRAIQAFDEGVFRFDASYPTLVRWKSPLVVEVSGNANVKTATVMEKVRKVARHTGTEVYHANNLPKHMGKGTLLKVLFSKDKNFVIKNNEPAGCFARLKTNKKDHTVTSARIVIGSKFSKGETCLEHELMHAAGMLGHVPYVDSVLSYVTNRETITHWDELFLSVMYNDALRPGMKRAEVMPIVSNLIAGKMNGGDFHASK